MFSPCATPFAASTTSPAVISAPAASQQHHAPAPCLKRPVADPVRVGPSRRTALSCTNGSYTVYFNGDLTPYLSTRNGLATVATACTSAALTTLPSFACERAKNLMPQGSPRQKAFRYNLRALFHPSEHLGRHCPATSWLSHLNPARSPRNRAR